MFALLDLSEEKRGLSLKCDPEYAIELRERYPEVVPAYHFKDAYSFPIRSLIITLAMASPNEEGI
jgi:hypothetical protein